MIKLLFIPLVVILSCGSSKKNQSIATPDPLQEGKTAVAGKDTIPPCVRMKIDSFKLKEKHEQPQKVTEYTYKGKKVYYVTMPCCDFFNEVYDDKCNYLGAPDGGFTGRGDGKIPDFAQEAKNEKVIWQAKKD
ncbi:MAG TPA: hypothetical protein PLA61_00435 [Ferruginibacter sp.]|nr:hypothetical protein [Chitinophagales bacterium]HQQ99265.1 hypothetical protein [Ferruginibacter sp.]